jgi:uncharacterized DUF497 family protein
MEFDWNLEKDRKNRHKHGFSLSAGQHVFADPNRLEEYDDRDYG